MSIDKINRKKAKNKNSNASNTKPQINNSGNGSSKTNKNECGRCGGPKHSRSQCPANNAVCHVCKIVGHFGKKCRTKKIHDVEQSSAATTTPPTQVYTPVYLSCSGHHSCSGNSAIPPATPNTLFMGLLVSAEAQQYSAPCNYKCGYPCEVKNRKEINIGCVDWVENTELENINVQFKVDTGAQANVLPLSLYKKHFESDRSLSRSNVKLTGYGGGNIPVSGEVNLNCKFQNNNVNSKFIVVPLEVKPVLGLHTSYQLGLVNPNASVSAVRESCMQRDSSVCDVTNTKVSGTHPSIVNRVVETHKVDHSQTHSQHCKGSAGVPQSVI